MTDHLKPATNHLKVFFREKKNHLKQENYQLEASYHVTKRTQLQQGWISVDVKLIFLSDKGSQIMNETVNRGTRT